MIQGLRGMFENQARVERYNISKALFACKLVEGKKNLIGEGKTALTDIAWGRHSRRTQPTDG
jgi:hypothetical protein